MEGKHGFFIVLEGSDGCGKSTKQRLLGERLKAAGYDVALGKEPTDGAIAHNIRALLALKEENSSRGLELQRLYLEDRREDIARNILPALEAGRVLLWDRYEASTEVYAVAEGASWETIEHLRDALLGSSWPRPDLEVVLRLEPEECLRRLATRGKGVDYFETKATLQKICAAYDEYVRRRSGAVTIDGSRSIREVADTLEKTVLAHLRR